jgi:PelA/Pel-15E family pectate lyase
MIRGALLACLLALPPGEVAAPPGVDGNTAPRLDRARVAALPPAERAAWTRYLERSERLAALDRGSMDRELRAAGQARMTPGPFRRAFHLEPEMTAAWFKRDEAARMADNLLTFQTPSGGWSKRVEVLLRPRKPGESYFSENDGWQYIATIDNDSTTEELRFVAAAQAAHPEARYREAFGRGLQYLLDAQFPNGCWPQVYPLGGGYHDAATYNDNAIVNVLRLLDDVAAGRFPFVGDEERRRAAAAAAQGVGCVLATQVRVGGVLTVWAQQHDALTLRPVAARSYELAGLCGRESAGVTAYLMSLPAPDARVVEAVHAAVAWFRLNQITGHDYDAQNGFRVAPGAGPLWARLYEIETGRPIFSNRDGIKRYDWNELTDRRHGYGWYTKEPAEVLAAYDAWAARHPRLRPPAGGR